MAGFTRAKAEFSAIDKLTKPLRKMARETEKFSKRVNVAFARADRSARKLTKSVGSLGVALGAGVLIMAATSVIKVFADYEQSNAGLAAVMNKTIDETVKLQQDSLRLGATTAKTATEVVGLQEAFARLGFAEQDILNMTEATISGSVAMKSELAETAELVGAMVKSFDNLESVNAPTIIDQMTLATQKSALNFHQLQTALPIVAGAANAAGVDFTKLLALLGKLSDAGIDASSSSTALRNIFIDSAAKGRNYEQILAAIQKNQDKLTAANDEFGKRGAVSSVILSKQIADINELDKTLQRAAGTAQTAADKQLDTLNGRLTILGSAWEGFILSVEKGDGAFGSFLKTAIEVATEILSIASVTSKAESELSSAQKSVRKMAEQALFLIDVIKWTTVVMIALKIAVLATKAVMIGANFLRFALIFTKIAKANSLWTASQWALNFAMNANPIGLIITGVALLVAGILLLVKNWDSVVRAFESDTIRSALMLMLGPIGLIINHFDTLISNWQLLKKSFKEGGFLEGIKTFGKIILSQMIKPIAGFIELISKIPGLDFAEGLAEGLNDFNNSLGLNDGNNERRNEVDLKPTSVVSTEETIRREEKIANKNATFTFRNETGFETEIDNPSGVPILLSPTN